MFEIENEMKWKTINAVQKKRRNELQKKTEIKSINVRNEH